MSFILIYYLIMFIIFELYKIVNVKIVNNNPKENVQQLI